jgi:hypothetical protein
MRIVLISLGVLLALFIGWICLAIVRRRLRREEHGGQPPSEAEIREFILKIPQMAEDHRTSAREIFGVELDYSAESIQKLEIMIRDGWPDGPPIMLDQTVTAFGSYFGETIRAIHGGEWRYDDTHGLHFQVGTSDMKIFPFKKVRKRFVNGSEDSLTYFYSYIAAQQKGDITEG